MDVDGVAQSGTAFVQLNEPGETRNPAKQVEILLGIPPGSGKACCASLFRPVRVTTA